MRRAGIVLAGILLSSMAAVSQGTGMMSAPNTPGAAGPMMMMAPAVGGKVAFSSLEQAQALATKGPTVLFFAAAWCPTCQADLRQIEGETSRLGDITVVVVDYDRERDVKVKYGVTYQHTYVQIDSSGSQLAVWSGGGADGILKNVVRPAAR